MNFYGKLGTYKIQKYMISIYITKMADDLSFIVYGKTKHINLFIRRKMIAFSWMLNHSVHEKNLTLNSLKKVFTDSISMFPSKIVSRKKNNCFTFDKS